MSSQIQEVKDKLGFAIDQLCKTSWMFVKDPSRDFTRERKLPLHKVISTLLCMEGGSLTNELLRSEEQNTQINEKVKENTRESFRIKLCVCSIPCKFRVY